VREEDVISLACTLSWLDTQWLTGMTRHYAATAATKVQLGTN